MKSTVTFLVCICFVGVFAQAQSAPLAQNTSSGNSAEASNPELQDIKSDSGAGSKLPNLKSVGPLTPEEAARLTAKNLAKEKDGNASHPAAQVKGRNASQVSEPGKPETGDAVVEFRPAESTGGGQSKAAVIASDKSKSSLKRVHGELYGSKGAGGHAEGGSLGSTTKSGKTSVYIDSERAHSNLQP